MLLISDCLLSKLAVGCILRPNSSRPQLCKFISNTSLSTYFLPMKVNKTIYQALFQYYISGVNNRFPDLSSSGLETHLVATIEWILYAQSKSLDGGISASYNILKDKWAPSYPETTGYSIPTLIRFAKLYERDDILNAVFRMAEYELEVQLDEGGFPCIKQKGDGGDSTDRF